MLKWALGMGGDLSWPWLHGITHIFYPTSTGLALTDTAEANVQQLITGKVNRFRRTVDASNMLEIRWDFEARQLAQKFTDR